MTPRSHRTEVCDRVVIDHGPTGERVVSCGTPLDPEIDRGRDPVIAGICQGCDRRVIML